jgi:hypothetical protein
MLTRIVGVICILSLILPAAGLAQGFSQGDKVATLNGSGSSDEDFDNNLFSISGALNYFFTDRIEGAIRQTVSWAKVEGADSTWNAATRVAADYDFDFGRLWPFAGGSLGYIYGDNVKDTWVIGPEVGVRYFVNQTTFLLGMIEWEFFLDRDNNHHDTLEDSIFLYTAGIGFRW